MSNIYKSNSGSVPSDVLTTIVGNVGSGSPIANVFDIVGAGTISTSVVGNTLTISNSASGTVTSVSGTANRITSTGGATPVIDIASTYIGQNSITTLGTISTGVWNGTDVDLASGGTNASLTASNGGIFYSTATAGAILSGTATARQMLQSGANTTPAWSTATYPATAGTSGNLLTSDGTNFVSSAPANNLITVTGTLTNAQIKALHATPVQVLSAPGAGKCYRIVTSTGKFIYGGTNAFTAAAAQTITWYYSTAISGVTVLITNAVITTTSSVYVQQNPSVTNLATTIENQPLILYNPIATEITGNAANNNTVSYSLTYQILNI